MSEKYITTEAQRKAKAKWQEKNRDKAGYYSAKSTAKRFVREMADENDLEEILALIKERKLNEI